MYIIVYGRRTVLGLTGDPTGLFVFSLWWDRKYCKYSITPTSPLYLYLVYSVLKYQYWLYSWDFLSLYENTLESCFVRLTQTPKPPLKGLLYCKFIFRFPTQPRIIRSCPNPLHWRTSTRFTVHVVVTPLPLVFPSPTVTRTPRPTAVYTSETVGTSPQTGTNGFDTLRTLLHFFPIL